MIGKREVLRRFRETVSVGAEVTSGGKLFHCLDLELDLDLDLEVASVWLHRETLQHHSCPSTAAVLRAGADPPPPSDRGARGKGPYHGVKGALKEAVLVVKGRIRWRKGRIRCALTRRATTCIMNQPIENRPTFHICNSSLAHSYTVSHVLQN